MRHANLLKPAAVSAKAKACFCLAVVALAMTGCGSSDPVNVVENADAEALAAYNEMVKQDTMAPPSR
ncbi:hypothetical protein [Rhodopirellula sp. MGV]|uniref:hypothetical protein n=1 Tax=Rhodopirellula sp. MGV TaxID=2023130 RepID=UPI000B9742D3|nr:hypothetical protein [Rhodopirellula sp. MGV]